MLILLATMKVAPENQAQFEAVMTELVATVNAREPDVSFYQLCKDTGDDTAYCVVEAYAGEEAFKAHTQTEWFKAAYPRFAALLSQPPSVQRLASVG